VKVAIILALLEKFGFLSRGQIRELSEKMFGVKITPAQTYNLLKLLSFYGYVKCGYKPRRVRGEKGAEITEKGRKMLKKMKKEIDRISSILHS